MNQKLHKTVLTALFIALVSIASMLIRIPSPMQGYLNCGDCLCLLAGWLLGPFGGFLAGGLGSALSDLLSGYSLYVPGTFFIKGALSLSAALILRLFSKSKRKQLRLTGLCLSATVSEAVMILGYYIYARFLLGNGISAIATIPGNALQGAFGIVSGLLLYPFLRKALSGQTHLSSRK